MTGGGAFDSTVFPFILRGINLLGIDSVYCPMAYRRSVWLKLADEWKPASVLQEGITEYSLHDLPEVLNTILQGGRLEEASSLYNITLISHTHNVPHPQAF